MVLTGLSRQAARFQACSAFTGAGFTTKEAEQVTDHPVRRRIVMWLMLLGNAGVVTVISSLILTFVSTTGSRQITLRLAILAAGFLALWVVATDERFNLYLTRLVQWALQRWTELDVRDYARVLRLTDEYTVSELQVNPDSWLSNQRLDELQLPAEGIVVLGIQRSTGAYVGAPQPQTVIVPGDLLTIYGRDHAIANLNARLKDKPGDQSHQSAIAEQKAVIDRETVMDSKTMSHSS